MRKKCPDCGQTHDCNHVVKPLTGQALNQQAIYNNMKPPPHYLGDQTKKVFLSYITKGVVKRPEFIDGGNGHAKPAINNPVKQDDHLPAPPEPLPVEQASAKTDDEQVAQVEQVEQMTEQRKQEVTQQAANLDNIPLSPDQLDEELKLIFKNPDSFTPTYKPTSLPIEEPIRADKEKPIPNKKKKPRTDYSKWQFKDTADDTQDSK